jgi:hypothetical protein
MRDQPERPSHGLLIPWLVACVAIFTLNYTFELKDREIYRLYYDSLQSCEGWACLLISDDLRSPVFLGLVIGAQRLGIDINLLFSSIAAFSVTVIALSLRRLPQGHAGTRFLLISLALGAWIYLIQVKLCLGVALYLLAQSRRTAGWRIALTIAALLTHESVALLVVLQMMWETGHARRWLRPALAATVVVVLLLAFSGEGVNVLQSGWERVVHYNELMAQGEVHPISRLSVVSALMLAFLMAGAVLNVFGHLPLKGFVWLAMPWLAFLALAWNEVFALRISALVLMHAMLVVPLSARRGSPATLGMLLVALLFGAFALTKDVLLS